jgi:hypothetical protein
LAAIHAQIAGASAGTDKGSGLAFGGHATVPGSTAPQPLAAGSSGPVAFAGGSAAGSQGVVATQTIQPGGTTLQLHDGSSINLVGTVHLDPTLFHG